MVAALSSAQRPVTIDRARIERQMRDLAYQHAAGGMDDDAYIERQSDLRAQLVSLNDGSNTTVAPDRAVEWRWILGGTWQHADVPQEKADLLHAIYDRIIVAGQRSCRPA